MVGQDVLVANVAKYLSGQPVIGVNPEPERNSGVLVPRPPTTASGCLSVAPTRHCAASGDRIVPVRALMVPGPAGGRAVTLEP